MVPWFLRFMHILMTSRFGCAGTLMPAQESPAVPLHYMTLARGDAGSMELDRGKRHGCAREEARNAARYLGASFHPSIANDIEMFYTMTLSRSSRDYPGGASGHHAACPHPKTTWKTT